MVNERRAPARAALQFHVEDLAVLTELAPATR
jgi:hypothetical protein